MSIQIGKFLPEKDNKNYIDCSDYTQGRVYGRNETITEASKVEIGLDRDGMISVISTEMKEFWNISQATRDVCMQIADALIESDSKLIVRKEGR